MATPSITLGECVRSQRRSITCKIRPGFPSDFIQSCKRELETGLEALLFSAIPMMGRGGGKRMHGLIHISVSRSTAP